MKNIYSALTAAVLTTALALTSYAQADATAEFGIGYRTDDISWSFDAPTTLHSDSDSKLRLKDLEIFALHARIKSRCGDCLYYRLDGTYGWIQDGTLRERDRFSRAVDQNCFECVQESLCNEGSCVVSPFETVSIHPKFSNDVNHKYVADFDVGIGYPLEQCWCTNLQVVPAIGFTYSTQRIRASGRHNVCDSIEDNYPNVNLENYGINCEGRRDHNNFRTTWWGPWVGFDLAYCDGGCWNVYGEFEYFFGRARAQRNTNSGFESFDDHRSTKWANGYALRVGSHYYFRCNWLLDGFITYKRFHSRGHDTELTWRAVGVGLALGYTF